MRDSSIPGDSSPPAVERPMCNFEGTSGSYRPFFDDSPLPLWVYDIETLRFVAVNEAAIEHYGYTRDEFLAMSITDIRPAEELPGLLASIRKVRSGHGARRLDHSGVWRHRRKGGDLIDVEITSHVLAFGGRPAELVLAHDVTARYEQASRIMRLDRVREVIGGISSAMVRIRDRDELLRESCRIASSNDAFALVWIVDAGDRDADGVQASCGARTAIEALLNAAALRWPIELQPSFRALRSNAPAIINDLAGAGPELEGMRPEFDAHGYRSIAAFPLRVDGAPVATMVFVSHERGFFDAEEVTLLEWLTGDLGLALESIERSSKLAYLSLFDRVTGLPGGELFEDRLTQLLVTARGQNAKLAIVALDLEHFTRINESIGRARGNLLLEAVGSRLRDGLADPCTLARIGADTFAVASPRGEDGVETYLRDRLVAALAAPFTVDGHELRVTAQFGIAIFPDDGTDATSLFESAESALKCAREAGKPWAYFSRGRDAQMREVVRLEEELREALDLAQFELAFQPRIDLGTGELVGAEALLRWRHPRRGILMPGDFVALAEARSLIDPIGAWVVDAVCDQQSRWLRLGVGIVPIAVNLSPRQLEDGALVAGVSAALRRHQLDPCHLDFELTESALMAEPDVAVRVLSDLRKLGVRLALDDFGTGYSSLAQLKRFPFDAVKIDRTFVKDITSNPDDAAIATTIIAMGHQLGLKVVAEGVECEGQLRYLRSRGCDEMQGHYFSEAITAEKFEQLLRGRRRLAFPGGQPGEARTLLVIDNEPGVRSALLRLLRRDGYRVLTADSAEEALKLLAVHDVGVVLCDQRMPGMNGSELMGMVRKLYPDTTRMMLSGYTDIGLLTEAVNEGAVSKVFTKPWDDAALRAQVREAFDRRVPQVVRAMVA